MLQRGNVFTGSVLHYIRGDNQWCRVVHAHGKQLSADASWLCRCRTHPDAGHFHVLPESAQTSSSTTAALEKPRQNIHSVLGKVDEMRCPSAIIAVCPRQRGTWLLCTFAIDYANTRQSEPEFDIGGSARWRQRRLGLRADAN